jgi:hypothetical protein
MVPMIPGRMRSSNLSVVVDLVVRVVCAGCACVVWACVFVYEQTLQLYPDERLSKSRTCTVTVQQFDLVYYLLCFLVYT